MYIKRGIRRIQNAFIMIINIVMMMMMMMMMMKMMMMMITGGNQMGESKHLLGKRTLGDMIW